MNVEVAVDGGVRREKPLGSTFRIELLLFALPSSNDQVRALRSVVVEHALRSESIARLDAAAGHPEGRRFRFGTGAKFRVLRHRLCGSADYASLST